MNYKRGIIVEIDDEHLRIETLLREAVTDQNDFDRIITRRMSEAYAKILQEIYERAP